MTRARDDAAPPAGRVPHIADGAPVSPDAVHFPSVKSLGVNHPLHVAGSRSGIPAWGYKWGKAAIEPRQIVPLKRLSAILRMASVFGSPDTIAWDYIRKTSDFSRVPSSGIHCGVVGLTC